MRIGFFGCVPPGVPLREEIWCLEKQEPRTLHPGFAFFYRSSIHLSSSIVSSFVCVAEPTVSVTR